VDKRMLTVLLIDDSPEYAHLVQYWLSGAHADVELELVWRGTLAAGIDRLERGGVDVILLDLGLPDCQGFETYIQTRVGAPRTPIIVLGSSDLDSVALGIIRKGAEDYLLKNACGAEVLVRAVRYASQSAPATSLPSTETPGRIVVQIPRELPRQLVAEYLDDCGNILAELREAMMQRDHERARICGHGMKGTGRPYGFPMLTEIGAAIERAATSDGAPELEKQVDRLDRYLDCVELA
jgi:CheY-like chemotaxis protein/HPt (histidine-containing phosphotransfer) domain-containing protein